MREKQQRNLEGIDRMAFTLDQKTGSFVRKYVAKNNMSISLFIANAVREKIKKIKKNEEK